jgi:hypothetical protein
MAVFQAACQAHCAAIGQLAAPPQGAFDCLVRDFRFATRFRYEIVTSYFAVGNV